MIMIKGKIAALACTVGANMNHTCIWQKKTWISMQIQTKTQINIFKITEEIRIKTIDLKENILNVAMADPLDLNMIKGTRTA